MALSSMTGFSRGQGKHGLYGWAWEIKSVNAKGIDVRLRLPPGWDGLEVPVRAKVAEALTRGTVYVNLTVKRDGGMAQARINEPVLNAVLATLANLKTRVDAAPPSLDGILALKGVVDVVEECEKEEERQAAEAAAVQSFAAVLNDLVAMRRHEGEALKAFLLARLDDIATLTARADAAPGRHPEAIRTRLAEQVATLLAASDRFDPDRLHQEALMLASKADIREELDRLTAHVAQARQLLKQGGSVGRRLDFLAQEFNRETNTLCSKSNDVELTNIGLELKTLVEQFREQIQNLE